MLEFIPKIFLEMIILFIVAESLLCASPGPAVLLIISKSMKNGFSAGIYASFGILAANLLYFILSAIGVGALIITSSNIFTIVKYIGAAYLVFMGVKMLIPLVQFIINKQPEPTADEHHETGDKEAPWAVFSNGFIIQASNPQKFGIFCGIIAAICNPIHCRSNFNCHTIFAISNFIHHY